MFITFNVSIVQQMYIKNHYCYIVNISHDESEPNNDANTCKQVHPICLSGVDSNKLIHTPHTNSKIKYVNQISSKNLASLSGCTIEPLIFLYSRLLINRERLNGVAAYPGGKKIGKTFFIRTNRLVYFNHELEIHASI